MLPSAEKSTSQGAGFAVELREILLAPKKPAVALTPAVVVGPPSVSNGTSKTNGVLVANGASLENGAAQEPITLVLPVVAANGSPPPPTSIDLNIPNVPESAPPVARSIVLSEPQAAAPVAFVPATLIELDERRRWFALALIVLVVGIVGAFAWSRFSGSGQPSAGADQPVLLIPSTAPSTTEPALTTATTSQSLVVEDTVLGPTATEPAETTETTVAETATTQQVSPTARPRRTTPTTAAPSSEVTVPVDTFAPPTWETDTTAAPSTTATTSTTAAPTTTEGSSTTEAVTTTVGSTTSATSPSTSEATSTSQAASTTADPGKSGDAPGQDE